MNKQELIAKIAKDTGSSKAGAAAAVRLDHLCRLRHIQDVAEESAHGAQSADRCLNQGPQAARRTLQRGQSAEERC